MKIININTLKSQKACKEYAAEIGCSLDGCKGLNEMRAKLFDFTHPEGLSSNALNKMYEAIVGAHRTGNKAAITADDALRNGVGTLAYNEYKYKMNALYDLAVAYANHVRVDVANMSQAQRDLRQVDLEADRAALWTGWKDFVRVGNDHPFHKNMWIEETDVEDLRVFATSFVNVQGVGTQYTNSTPGEFACFVEKLIGCRVAIANILTPNELSILQKYENARKALLNAEKKLKGYTPEHGDKVLSLDEQIENATKDIDDTIKTLNDAGVTDNDVIDKVIVAKRLARKQLIADREQTEKNKQAAQKVIAELTPYHNALISKCKAHDALCV